jgi:hypothetical protein
MADFIRTVRRKRSKKRLTMRELARVTRRPFQRGIAREHLPKTRAPGVTPGILAMRAAVVIANNRGGI